MTASFDPDVESPDGATAGFTMFGDEAAFEALLVQLRADRGFDFTGYKRASLARRVDLRLRQLEIASYADYGDLLEVSHEEFTLLFNTVLINVTGFFRDPEAWDYLSREVLPQLIASVPTGQIRIWSAGCASGEEAYTLAIALAEAMGVEQVRERVKIYATDIDEEALAQARAANYPESALEGMPGELREKYFEAGPAGLHTFHRDLRRSVIFGRNDLVQDAPISRVHLLVCRNVMIYLNAETQAKILSRFHFATRPGGYLFLGKAETLLSHARLFTQVDLQQRVFTPVAPGPSHEPAKAGMTTNARAELGQLALEASVEAQVVFDNDLLLAFVNGPAQSMFTMSLRDIGRPLRELEISYRPVELGALVGEVATRRRPVKVDDVEWARGDEPPLFFDVCVEPLVTNDGRYLGTSVTISDVTPERRLRDGYHLATQRLEAAYEHLQSTNEELETTNEELQSTVEELETTNEELQSANGELELLNDELQSTNEALQTINGMLRDRTLELDQLRGFLDSVTGSLRAGLISVDTDQRVSLWSRQAEEQWGLGEDEAMGRALADLDIGLPLDRLSKMVGDVLSGVEASTSVRLTAVDRLGHSTETSVTVAPLVEADGARRGAVVLTEPAP